MVARSAADALDDCTRAISRVSACLPQIGSPAQSESVVIPEMRAAFVTLKPALDLSPSLIQCVSAPQAAVLVFGSQAGANNLADTVLQEFVAGGISRVAQMTGSLSAVVIDRMQRRVWTTGTLLGHRSLFYCVHDGRFMVSPHDLTLLATARVPFAIDYSSLSSMVACDWSLEGRSLLVNVTRCHPLEALCWDNDSLRTHSVNSLNLAERLDVNDRTAVGRQMDCLVEEVLSSVRSHVQGASRARCSLTAGMDSRAVLAAICGATHGLPIHTSTSGGSSSEDVVVASRLAALVGANHERQEPTRPTLEDFARTLRLKAFFCSGDTSAKRAMTRLPGIDPSAELLAGGNGGEIYRGFFYQYFGVTGTVPRDVGRIARRLLNWRFRRLAQLPFAEPAFKADVSNRLLLALVRLERCSTDPYDILDLLYLFERYGRWGASQASQPWSRTWTPFESAAAIRAAFRLPSPMGRNCSVHSLLIQRFLPKRAYWIPINGGQLLALDGNGRIRYALRQTLTVGAMVRQQVRRRLRKSARRGDDVKASFLSGELSQITGHLMDEEGSLSRVLFGREGVRTLLGRHQQRQDQLAAIGILLTAETWKHIASELTRP